MMSEKIDGKRIDRIMELVTVLFIILVFAYMFKFFIAQPAMIGGGECIDADCHEVLWGLIAKCNKKPNMECIKIKYKECNKVMDNASL